MPRVPQLEPSVQPQPVRPQLLPISAPGSIARQGQAVAGALAGVSATFAKIAEDERRKADAATLAESATEISLFSNELLNGKEGQGGLFSAFGETAMPKETEVLQSFHKRGQEILHSLPDRLQEEFSARILDRSRLELRTQTSRWVRTQNDKRAEQAFQARVESLRSAALGAAADPVQMGRIIGDGIDQLRDWGERMGMPNEAVDRQVGEWRSGTLRAAVLKLIDDDRTSVARELFDDVEEFVLPEHVGQLRQQLEPAETRDKARLQVAELMEGIPRQYRADDLEGVYDQIDAIDDVDVRDHARREADRQFAEIDQARRLEQDETLERSWNVVQATGDTSRVPRADWSKLTIANREALGRLANSVLKGVGEVHPLQESKFIMTNWENRPVLNDEGEVVGLVPRTAAEKAGQGPNGVNLLSFFGEVNPATLNVLRKEQNALEAKLQGKPPKPILTYKQRFANIRESDLAKDKEDRRWRWLENEGATRIEAKQAELGRELTSDEIDQVTNDMLREVSIRVPWRSDSKVPIALTRSPEFQGKTAYIPLNKIDAEHQQVLRRYLEEATESDVIPRSLLEDTYLQWIRGDQPIADKLDGMEQQLREEAEGGSDQLSTPRNEAIEGPVDDSVDDSLEDIDQAIIRKGLVPTPELRERLRERTRLIESRLAESARQRRAEAALAPGGPSRNF